MDQVLNISNFLVKTTVDTTLLTLKPILKQFSQSSSKPCKSSLPSSPIVQDAIFALSTNMSRWISVAGLMGASAVALGAYGAHVVYPRSEIPDNRKAQFETANKYHFLHSLALLGVPFVRRPNIPGTLFVVGTLLFSGSCYYMAINDTNPTIAKYTPIGGMTLIVAWLSLVVLA